MKKLSDKGKKRKTQSPLALLQSVARQSRKHTARHLLETGLYAGQEQIIALLAENDVMTPSEIARELDVRPPTVTKSITRLAEQGLVARSSGQGDGRQVQIQLTEAGNNILKTAHKATVRAEKQALKDLSTSQRADLVKALNAISDTLETRETKLAKKAAKRAAKGV